MKIINDIADILTRHSKSAQEKREGAFIKLDNPMLLGSLDKEAITPNDFLQTVNEYLGANVENFKPFTLKDIEVLDVFAADKKHFICTVYAVRRSYGFFHVKVQAKEVYFSHQSETIMQPASTFRIYLTRSQSKAVFAGCVLKKGKVWAKTLFVEFQTPNGDFSCEACKKDNLPQPIEKLL